MKRHHIFTGCRTYVLALCLSLGFGTMTVSAQSVDQSTLEALQSRIIAVEETLREVNARIENDLFALQQNLEAGGDVVATLERVDQRLNAISNLSNEISALNQKIQKILQLATDNEFRILRVETQLQTLMRHSTLSPIDAEGADAAPIDAEGTGTAAAAPPLTPTDAPTDAPSESSDDAPSESAVSQAGLDDGTTAIEPPQPSQLTDIAPTPSILPAGTEEEQYEFVHDLLNNGHYPEAESALIEFSTIYPESDLRPDVVFWLGRVQFVQEQHNKSLQTMSEFARTWPEDDRRIKVLMWIAESISVIRPANEACRFFDKTIQAIETPPEQLVNRIAKLRKILPVKDKPPPHAHFTAAMDAYALPKRRKAVLLAVSGGGDSMGLVALALNWRAGLPNPPPITALVVDHGLRQDSDNEAAEVVAILQARGVAAEAVRVASKRPAGESTGVSVWARQQRYALLRDAAMRQNAVIITAHHQDDQLETIEMRLGGVRACGGCAVWRRRQTI